MDSLENPHGHGGFLFPRGALACMTNGPLTDVEQGNSPTETGWMRAREKERAKSKGVISSPSSSTPSDSRSVTHDITTQLMETMEKQVDLSQERARHARFSHSCTRIFHTLALVNR